MLAVMPCADIHYCDHPNNMECALTQAQHNDNNDRCMDRCTPLCTCNCCMAAVAQIKEIHLGVVRRQLLADNDIPYLFSISRHAVTSVLQPPEFR